MFRPSNNNQIIIMTVVPVIVLILFVDSTLQQSILDDMNYPPTETGVSCVPIPNSIKLCRNLAYNEMRLPNLLTHESIAEVERQSQSWVPLLKKCCHPDLQLFLCSMFTPVCIKDNNTDMARGPGVPIYPCQSLCESVKDQCGPIMADYGFPWPSMLECNLFPVVQGMCIERQSSETTPCDPEVRGKIKYENINLEVKS